MVLQQEVLNRVSWLWNPKHWTGCHSSGLEQKKLERAPWLCNHKNSTGRHESAFDPWIRTVAGEVVWVPGEAVVTVTRVTHSVLRHVATALAVIRATWKWRFTLL